MIARVIILSGYGLNCEDETRVAFEHCGGIADIVHINDLIATPEKLANYQIMAIPGGFSYGDDTGSGNAFANKLRNRLLDGLLEFTARDTLTIGICNGCQILAHLGLVPGYELSSAKESQSGDEHGNIINKIGVVYNASNRYQCRWIDVEVQDSPSPWLKGIKSMHIPVGNGEGQMVMSSALLEKLKTNKQIAYRYVKPDGAEAKGEFPYNPNGSVYDVASVTDPTGRILATMPHPERGMFFTQRDDWSLIKEKLIRSGQPVPVESDGMAMFRNAINYFR